MVHYTASASKYDNPKYIKNTCKSITKRLTIQWEKGKRSNSHMTEEEISMFSKHMNNAQFH